MGLLKYLFPAVEVDHKRREFRIDKRRGFVGSELIKVFYKIRSLQTGYKLVVED